MDSRATANDVRAGAERLAGAVGDAADTASDFVQTTADSAKTASDYLRDQGGNLQGQIKDYLAANPSHALLGAVALGFILGRYMSRA